MARKTYRRAARRIGLLGALAGLLIGCSGNGGTHTSSGLPDPAPGTVAAFDLNTLSSHYDLNRAVSDIPSLSHVASDRAGNAYLMDSGSRQPIDILRMTPTGTVSRFASIASDPTTLGLAVLQGGVLAVGRVGGLLRVDGHGTRTALPTGHRFAHPDPIGARPDGSLVVLDAGRVWSVKNGHTTALAGKPSTSGITGTVDGSGTTYALMDGKTIDDMLAIPPGKPPQALNVTGHVPGGSTPISALHLLTIAPANDDGFYAAVENTQETTSYLVHVHGTTAQVLARASDQGVSAKGCRAGRHYPALDNPCVMPWFAVPLGKRILLIGQTNDTVPTPALALNTTSPKSPPR